MVRALFIVALFAGGCTATLVPQKEYPLQDWMVEGPNIGTQFFQASAVKQDPTMGSDIMCIHARKHLGGKVWMETALYCDTAITLKLIEVTSLTVVD